MSSDLETVRRMNIEGAISPGASIRICTNDVSATGTLIAAVAASPVLLAVPEDPISRTPSTSRRNPPSLESRSRTASSTRPAADVEVDVVPLGPETVSPNVYVTSARPEEIAEHGGQVLPPPARGRLRRWLRNNSVIVAGRRLRSSITNSHVGRILHAHRTAAVNSTIANPRAALTTTLAVEIPITLPPSVRTSRSPSPPLQAVSQLAPEAPRTDLPARLSARPSPTAPSFGNPSQRDADPYTYPLSPGASTLPTDFERAPLAQQTPAERSTVSRCECSPNCHCMRRDASQTSEQSQGLPTSSTPDENNSDSGARHVPQDLADFPHDTRGIGDRFVDPRSQRSRYFYGELPMTDGSERNSSLRLRDPNRESGATFSSQATTAYSADPLPGVPAVATASPSPLGLSLVTQNLPPAAPTNQTNGGLIDGGRTPTGPDSIDSNRTPTTAVRANGALSDSVHGPVPNSFSALEDHNDLPDHEPSTSEIPSPTEPTRD
ncbi:hypothetical protein W97_01421 [Coniosporium apollinis CBS 100218]|uniref:Uncharacterized protein n=1 Tax=Coniosporium apollinis (strain CBS 100218) TaxID=1168221 RepID=R7YKQ3_CONA1|nr:uncharacterized protein W97_01421 [Coniosporium apollinis CBS 100218]EON62201.1 hypothetical protein W97_01421 [Coniosporium apollinis CBS 100218]